MTTRFRQIPDTDVVEDLTDGLPIQESTLKSLEAFRRSLTVKLGFDVTSDQTLAWLLKEQGVSSPDTLFTKWNGAIITMPNFMTTPDMVKLEVLMRSGNKIPAIKFLREKSISVDGVIMGLKEAKEYVEQHWDI